MTTRIALDEAAARLAAALDAFEAAVHRRKANEETIRDLEEDVHLLAVDRSRLARELDETTARAAQLASVAAEVGARVDRAMVTIREIVTAEEG